MFCRMKHKIVLSLLLIILITSCTFNNQNGAELEKDLYKGTQGVVLEYFETNSRGQLILPCGAGKTLTSLWIKESMKPLNTLVLVPSLALLRQIKNDWAEQKKDKYLYICVCSDKDIDKSEKDSIVMHTYEIDSKVFTEPKNILNFLSLEIEKVIFSTYQSLEKIINAIENTEIQFDLIICDEAHRTAGAKTRLFSLVHDNDKIPAKKRLYMTATPRVTSTQLKNQIGDDIRLLYDMSNPIVYGDEIYRMSFKEAIEKKILVDYKIIAIGVNDDEIRKYIEERNYISENESIDEIANNFALEIVMNKYKAFHALTFHSRVKYAKQFSIRHSELFNYFTGHVNGTQSTSIRSIILNDFKNSDKAIVSNARCLTEGVDIPAIDLVYFCDPKNSKIDIVQAAGRALRTDHSRNKSIGYIVVPIFHSDKENIEKTINTGSFKNVIQVIRSLSDHDERLQDEINKIAFSKGKKQSKRIEISIGDENSEVITLINFKEKLKNSLFDQIIEKSSNNWDIMYIELSNLLSNNNKYPSKNDNPQLYSWTGSQRNRRKNNQLSNTKITKLDKIGFIWNSHETTWEEKFLELKQYRINNDYEPDKNEFNDLYQWYAIQKMAQKKGELTKERIELIESLKFKGSLQNKIWRETFDLLVLFRKNSPNKWPSQRSKEPVEHKLAVWFLYQRREYRQNIISDYRINKLNSIGFPWNPYDYKWKTFYIKLTNWLKTNKDFLYKPSSKNKNEISFYNWCNLQKDKYLKNELSSEQMKLLDKIDFKKFIDYEPEIIDWDDCFDKVKTYYNKNAKFPSYDFFLGCNNTIKYGPWATTQRKLFKNGELEENQISKLKAIGFVFDTEKANKEKWNDIFLQLIDFRNNHPDRWPYSNSEYEVEKKLAIWINHNRQRFKGNLKKYGKYPAERKKKLDSINFEWESERSAFGHIDDWDEKYEELKKQIDNNSFQTTGDNGKTNPIYTWVTYNKTKYKENRLDQEKIEKLKLLKIDFETNEITGQLNYSWDEFFDELKHQIENNEFKSIDENGKVTPVYNWLTRQKYKFREGKLDQKQINNLESLGIDLEINESRGRLNYSWDEFFDELKYQIENNEFKSTDTNGKTTRLYRWLCRQKDLYKENKLSINKIEKLLKLDINLLLLR